MLRTIERNIKKKNLLTHSGLHLVALSGGADSVALLRILLKLGYKLEAIHCNFNLRGAESERDEAFCKTLCDEMKVPLHIAHFDTKAYASLHHISIEMAARELRYTYFAQLRNDLDAESVCVAHHKDDQAETILLNIIRGSGIKGVTGMAEKRDFIVRPLLSVSRDEIVDFLHIIGQNYITDSSNLVADVKRNKLRLEIIPLLKSLNPSVVDAISGLSDNAKEAMSFTESALKEWKSKCYNNSEQSINIKVLKSSPSPEHLLYYLINNKGFTSEQIKDIYNHIDSQTGTVWEGKSHDIIIDRGLLVICEKQAQEKEYSLPIEGTYKLDNGSTIKIELKEKDHDTQIDKSPDCCMIDAQDIRFPLCLRQVKNADRFVPFGMKGSKLVSDFLTDKKIPLNKKRQQLMLVDATDKPLWLVGLRPDNRFRITSDTIKMLIVRYHR